MRPLCDPPQGDSWAFAQNRFIYKGVCTAWEENEGKRDLKENFGAKCATEGLSFPTRKIAPWGTSGPCALQVGKGGKNQLSNVYWLA